MKNPIAEALKNPGKILEKRVKERDIVKAAKEAFAALGWETRAIAWRGRRNCPDAMILRRGGPAFFVEFKAPAGTAREGQKREAEFLRERGFAVYVCRDAESLAEIIRRELNHAG